jgi:hypothetical protein
LNRTEVTGYIHIMMDITFLGIVQNILWWIWSVRTCLYVYMSTRLHWISDMAQFRHSSITVSLTKLSWAVIHANSHSPVKFVHVHLPLYRNQDTWIIHQRGMKAQPRQSAFIRLTYLWRISLTSNLYDSTETRSSGQYGLVVRVNPGCKLLLVIDSVVRVI